MRIFRGKLAKATIGALGLNIAEAGFGFLTALILARLLGPSSYGIYSYAIAIAGLLTIVCLLGQDKYTVRKVAKLLALDEPKSVATFARSTFLKVLLLLVIVSFVSISVLLYYRSQLSDEKFITIAIAICIMALTVLMRIYIGLLQGIHKVITALYPDKVLRPMSFLLLVVAIGLILDPPISAVCAISANALAALIALFVVSILWKKYRPHAKLPYSLSAALTSGW